MPTRCWRGTSFSLLSKMRVNYFEDPDTALIELTDQPVAETREVSESVMLDLDADGNLVSMTIEHASEKANIQDFSFERKTPLETAT